MYSKFQIEKLVLIKKIFTENITEISKYESEENGVEKIIVCEMYQKNKS